MAKAFSDIIHKLAWVDIYYFKANRGTATLSHSLSNIRSPTITRQIAGALVKCLGSRSSLNLSLALVFLIFKMNIAMEPTSPWVGINRLIHVKCLEQFLVYSEQ